MAPLLSILTVSQGQPFAKPFLSDMDRLAAELNAEFVVVADGGDAAKEISEWGLESANIAVRTSKGYIESILEEAVSLCNGRYILRLDDDEKVSEAMNTWLLVDAFMPQQHWCFPRMHMWPDASSVLMTPQLFPDFQTRLSLKTMSGGRHTLHAMSPFGMGTAAPVAIEHHKFIVKTVEERKAIAAKWHNGAMTAFSLPEEVYTEIKIVDSGDGTVPWQPKWTENVYMSLPK